MTCKIVHMSCETQFGDLRICTMTCTANLSDTDMDLDSVWERIRLSETGILSVRSPCGQQCRPEGSMSLGKTFGRQITMHVFNGRGSSSVKLFRTGSLQITGLRCRDEGVDVARTVAESLVSDTGDDVRSGDVNVQMINANFKYFGKLDRFRLLQYLRESYPTIDSRFDPATGTELKVRLCYSSDDVDAVNRSDGSCKCGDGRNCAVDPIRRRSCFRCCVTVYRSGSIVLSGKCERVHIDRSASIVKSAVSALAFSLTTPTAPDGERTHRS